MRPVSAGKVRATAATTVHITTATAAASRDTGVERFRTEWPTIIVAARLAPSELHLWRGLRGVVGGKLSHRLVGSEQRRGPDDAGEGLQLGVVHAHSFDVVAPRDA